MNLNLKSILKLKKTFLKIGKKVPDWIEDDMDKGVLQKGKGKYSKQYKKYKNNWMERFTDRTGRAGTKLKAYQGSSINSNYTKSVNMKLTGQTIKGLHIEAVNETSVTMSYDKKDLAKIEGNKELGREIATLNKTNISKAESILIKDINLNIDKYVKEKIVITV